MSIDSSNPKEQITIEDIERLCMRHGLNRDEFMQWFQYGLKIGIFRQVGHDMYVFSSREVKLAMMIKTAQLKSKGRA